MSTKYVYFFGAGKADGRADMKDLLGGKGANLAEMTNIGLPVPPGFTITTEACRYYLEHGGVPDGLAGEVDEHLRRMEGAMGRQLTLVQEIAAGLGGNDEPGRHRQPQIGHLRQVGPFTTQQIL